MIVCVAVIVGDSVAVADALRVDVPLVVTVGDDVPVSELLGESDVVCVSARAHSRSTHSSDTHAPRNMPGGAGTGRASARAEKHEEISPSEKMRRRQARMRNNGRSSVGEGGGKKIAGRGRRVNGAGKARRRLRARTDFVRTKFVRHFIFSISFVPCESATLPPSTCLQSSKAEPPTFNLGSLEPKDSNGGRSRPESGCTRGESSAVPAKCSFTARREAAAPTVPQQAAARARRQAATMAGCRRLRARP